GASLASAVLRSVSATNFFGGNPDLVEVFDRVMPWAAVVRAVEGPEAKVDETVSTWREVLDVAGRYIASEIAPRAAKVDELGVIRENGTVRMNEPMTDNLRGLAELGLASPSVPAEVGGAGLPFTVTVMIAEVLGRGVAGSSGLDGLGMFIAEREGDNYAVERAEHKFTIRGSPTCALVFEGTRATALGKPGDGWKQILTFMNESRLGVGIQGIGVATAALAKASEYAATRVQLGKPIREHPMVAEMLLDMETTVAGARALAYEAAALQDRAMFGGDQTAARDVRELTPLVKWYGTEGAVRVCRLALQVHGGYGVVDE